MAININEMDVRAGVLSQSIDDNATPGLQISFQDRMFHFGLGFSWFDKRCLLITIVMLIVLLHTFHAAISSLICSSLLLSEYGFSKCVACSVCSCEKR